MIEKLNDEEKEIFKYLDGRDFDSLSDEDKLYLMLQYENFCEYIDEKCGPFTTLVYNEPGSMEENIFEYRRKKFKESIINTIRHMIQTGDEETGLSLTEMYSSIFRDDEEE